MKLFPRLQEKFGKAFVPRKFIPSLRAYLLKAGYQKVPYRVFGILFYVTVLLTAAIYLFLVYPHIASQGFVWLFLMTFLSWTLLHIAITAITLFSIYFYLDLKIFKRTQAIEEQLADFLQYISSNLKGGLTFENAMWSAINPRFKILSLETTEVMKKVMTGTSTSEALMILANKYNSPMLRRTIELIISELESGGDIAKLLDRMIEDLEKTKEVKEQLVASVIGYVIMITIIVLFIAPILFALSFYLLSTITGFLQNISPLLTSNSSLPIKLGTSKLDPKTFKIFSIIALLTISFVSSFVVSVIEKGHIKSGIKYIPLYLLGSLATYFIFLKLISGIFTFAV